MGVIMLSRISLLLLLALLAVAPATLGPTTAFAGDEGATDGSGTGGGSGTTDGGTGGGPGSPGK
jgi:hypothetical protein